MKYALARAIDADLQGGGTMKKYVLVRATSILGSAATVALAAASCGSSEDLAEAVSSVELDQSNSPFTQPSPAGEMYLDSRSASLPAPLPRATSHAEVASEPPQLISGAPGTDVLVNDPTDDTPENTTQSETSMAVRGNTICAGYNNSGPGGFSGLSRSTNLGTTWTDLNGIGQSGDPVLAVDQGTGTFYYGEIATIGGNPAIGVARSTDDCQTFGAAVDASPVSSGLAGTILNDKPWVAVDNTGGANDGNVYVCWTRFFDTNGDGNADSSELRFSRSLDGGLTYQDEQILQPNGTAPFGCSVGVGPNGEVHVAWADRAGATANDIRFRSSVDAGLTFSTTISVSTGNRHPGTDNIVNCGGGDMRPALNGDIRMLHQAWMAVDTTGGAFDGNIYVTWASDPAGGVDQSDVFLSRSTNGGATWSAPLQLGAGGGATDQFEPFVAVGGAGAVGVAWYDRRNDAANNLNIDVFRAFSTDGAANFGALARVTDVSFPVPPINPNFDPGVVNCYMGEYISVAADANNFYYMWGDNRNTLVTPAFPGGRPDPDVFFDAELAPNFAPTADICADVFAECKAQNSPVQLDGTCSSDPEGQALTFLWSSPTCTFADPTVAKPTALCPIGVNAVTLVVTDSRGASSAPDTATVTLVDTTPPVVDVTLSPNVLRPPNHKLRTIHATVAVTDACDPNASFVLTSITSDEPDEGLGDGNFPNDIQGALFGTPDTQFLLRSERSGRGDGRIYTVVYTASDASGNDATDSAFVKVPHN